MFLLRKLNLWNIDVLLYNLTYGCLYLYTEIKFVLKSLIYLQWRHNGCDGVSNHQPHGCLLNRIFRCRKRESSASLAFLRGIHRWPVNSLHKWPVTRKKLLVKWNRLPDSKDHGANMGPIWGRQAPCWPHGLCYLGWYRNSSLTTNVVKQ